MIFVVNVPRYLVQFMRATVGIKQSTILLYLHYT